MEDIKIIDNFLPTVIQDLIEEISLSTSVDWIYNKGTLENVNHKNFKDAEQFVNLFLVKGQFQKSKFDLYFLLPLLLGTLKIPYHMKLEDIYRAKINMTLKQPEISEGFVNPPHIDQALKEGVDLAAIYYINDSDGDTLLYEGNIIQELKLVKKVSPKKGRLLIMRGDRFHSSSHPTKTDRRLVVNYNIKFK